MKKLLFMILLVFTIILFTNNTYAYEESYTYYTAGTFNDDIIWNIQSGSFTSSLALSTDIDDYALSIVFNNSPYDISFAETYGLMGFDEETVDFDVEIELPPYITRARIITLTYDANTPNYVISNIDVSEGSYFVSVTNGLFEWSNGVYGGQIHLGTIDPSEPLAVEFCVPLEYEGLIDNLYNVSYDVGYDAGIDVAYDVGYDDGKGEYGYYDTDTSTWFTASSWGNIQYTFGQASADDNVIALKGFIPGILGAVFAFFFQVASIGVLGVSLLDIIGAVFGIVVLIFVIKFILGK